MLVVQLLNFVRLLAAYFIYFYSLVVFVSYVLAGQENILIENKISCQ